MGRHGVGIKINCVLISGYPPSICSGAFEDPPGDIKVPSCGGDDNCEIWKAAEACKARSECGRGRLFPRREGA
jgi:hypothetical protein